MLQLLLEWALQIWAQLCLLLLRMRVFQQMLLQLLILMWRVHVFPDTLQVLPDYSINAGGGLSIRHIQSNPCHHVEAVP